MKKTPNDNTLTIMEVEKLLGKNRQTIRVLMQTGQLPIGFAVKTSKRYQYIITKAKFTEVTGIEV